jgi:hypothetical protein
MHVALVIDEERLAQEQAMLNRMCIGLMAEGVQVTRIVPDNLTAQSIGEGEQRVALASRIQAPMRVLRWMRHSRVVKLTEAIDEAIPDVLYAVGQQSWDLANDLAEALERPLLIDVWSAAQGRMLPRAHDAPAIAGYVAPCSGIDAALRKRIDRTLISLVPMGVSMPAEPRFVLPGREQAPALAILGGTRDVIAYRLLFQGLAQVIREQPEIQTFLELRGQREHEIWREAEQAGLLGSISAIGDAATYRRLLTRCDGVLMPEGSGELRSIMLEAMATGIPIIAVRDAALNMLKDDETAWLVDRPSPEQWARQIGRLLEEPQSARALGQRARTVVGTSHRSSDQVFQMLGTLAQATSGGAYRFKSHAP